MMPWRVSFTGVVISSHSPMVCFVLHTHLPYVLHHGAWPHGSDWLCEAVAECYMPLINMCDRLADDGIRAGLTLDISPILCEQLAHQDFPALFERYCAEHADLAKADAALFAEQGAEPERIAVATFWQQWYEECAETFREVYDRDIVGQFRRLQDAGIIEIMTCGATHGYFPLLAEDESIYRQVEIAVRAHERHFGRHPRGIWLPECAYRPGYPWRTFLPVFAYSQLQHRESIESILQRHSLQYFVSDEGALSASRPLGFVDERGNRTPTEQTVGTVRQRLEHLSAMDVYRVGSAVADATVSVFTRHTQTALQVWSGSSGYPGDADYLDFHKKFSNSALRYWRVTDNKADMAYKQPYVREWAVHRAREHGRHYAALIEQTLHNRRSQTDAPVVLTLPFDTELFGHWWFEGPLFLEEVLRCIHASPLAHCTTLGECHDVVHPDCVIALPESSWGKDGDHSVWMNEQTQWTWEREYQLEYRLRALFEKHPQYRWTPQMRNVARTIIRQILLAQASDWQFLISTFSAKDYAEMRFHNHVEDAKRCCDIFERLAVTGLVTEDSTAYLRELDERDNIFEAEIDLYLARHGS
ncbi:MAG: DUF1957 domain-containing protein [Candidatus Kapabacteria bacterium]|nr:DUF1957 domain-containing protein [Candidatus Kapabacteria bacterium]